MTQHARDAHQGGTPTGIEQSPKAPLIRSALPISADSPRGRCWAWVSGAWCTAILPPASTSIGCHAFRAIGITPYLTNGRRIEVAQRMARHSNAKTTGLYDRRNAVSVGEAERIGISCCQILGQ
jgi:integrase/recombinase XerD